MVVAKGSDRIKTIFFWVFKLKSHFSYCDISKQRILSFLVSKKNLLTIKEIKTFFIK